MHVAERLEQARAVIATVVQPIVDRVPAADYLAAEDWRTMFRALKPLGYLGSTIPEALGGAGLSYVVYGRLLEELARGPLLLGEVVPPRTINYLGSAAQKARWLPGLFSGALVSTAAITEPQAGSDLRNLQCTAREVAGGFVVNGRKKYIKLGGVSDMMTVLVNTGMSPDGKKLTSRLVLERAQSPWQAIELDAVGLDRISYAELVFEDVFVPAENMLGAAGQGAEQFNRGIEASRAFIGIQSVGLAQRALDLAIAFTTKRHAFGRALAGFQAIQTQLANAATELEAARALCLHALAELDGGTRAPKLVAMAKLFASETAVRVCHAAMDSMGAAGLAREEGVERCWRDCRMLTVIDGASGIQRLIIGREIFGVSAFV